MAVWVEPGSVALDDPFDGFDHIEVYPAGVGDLGGELAIGHFEVEDGELDLARGHQHELPRSSDVERVGRRRRGDQAGEAVR